MKSWRDQVVRLFVHNPVKPQAPGAKDSRFSIGTTVAADLISLSLAQRPWGQTRPPDRCVAGHRP